LKQVWADGQQVGAGEPDDLVDFAKTRAHHLGLVVVAFVVVVDPRYRRDTRILIGGNIHVAPPLLVPVVHHASSHLSSFYSRLATRHGLVKTEQQRKIAINALAFQLLSGANAFPGAGYFDQNSLARNARLFIEADQASRLGQTPLDVKTESGVDLGGYPAGNDL